MNVASRAEVDPCHISSRGSLNFSVEFSKFAHICLDSRAIMLKTPDSSDWRLQTWSMSRAGPSPAKLPLDAPAIRAEVELIASFFIWSQLQQVADDLAVMAFVRGEPSSGIVIGSIGKYVAKPDAEYLSWRLLFDEVYLIGFILCC